MWGFVVEDLDCYVPCYNLEPLSWMILVDLKSIRVRAKLRIWLKPSVVIELRVWQKLSLWQKQIFGCS
jgi:hypothetical protein